MTPILYNGTETAFSSNGLGRIPCTSCIVREERNGIFECTFTVPVSEDIYPKITEGKIIYCIHDDAHDAQPFDIYAKSAPMNGLVTFRAHHISYRLSKMVCKPFNATTCADAISKISDNIIGTNPFTFWTNKSVTATMNNEIPSTVRSLLAGSTGSVLDVYGKGEYQFDKFNVNLYLNRGVDKGVTIRYGKNLTDITQETDISQTYNAVAPYWVSAETGTIITLDAGMVVKTDQVVDNQIKCVPLDLSGDFDTAPTQQQLSDRASAWLDSSSAWVMKENLTVDFVALWQSPEYENYAALERVSLCDKVSVIHPILGIAANKIEVIAVEYDVLRERYTRMELGQPKATYADVLKAETVQSVLSQVPSTDVMEQAIAYASEMITGAMGGCVVVNRDANGKPFELLILDTDNINTAVNVWRWNTGGLGHSHNGYGGPYSDVALTADGRINANMITTGILTAIKIVNGNNTFVVETDGTVTAKAISITNGTINCGSGNFTVSSTGSVVAKAISITDGSIDCGNGNFTVSSAGSVTAKAINIQGGSINIDTDTQSSNIIKLRWLDPVSLYYTEAELAPLGLTLKGEGANESSTIVPKQNKMQAGQFQLYADSVLRSEWNPYTMKFFDSSGNQRTLVDGSGFDVRNASTSERASMGYAGVFFRDSSQVLRSRYDNSSTNYYNSSGTLRALYGSGSLTYRNDSSNQLANYGMFGLTLYDSLGSETKKAELSSITGLKFFDTAGSTTVVMTDSGLTVQDTSSAKSTVIAKNLIELHLTETVYAEIKNNGIFFKSPAYDTGEMAHYAASGFIIRHYGDSARVGMNGLGFDVRNANGDVAAEITASGFDIRNDSSDGVLIDGVGKSYWPGTWSWKQITTKDNKKSWIPAYTETSETSRLAANSDLNDLMENGNYVVYNADASTISNTPYTAGGFMVRVDFFAPESPHSSGMVVQALYPGYGSSTDIYVRRRYGASFGAWQKYVGSADGILPIASGGTGASTAAAAAQKLGVTDSQMAAGKTVTLRMIGNVALVYAKRDQDYILALVDYWTAGYITIASGGTSTPTITHTAASKEVSVTNNRSSGAVAAMLVGTGTYENVD